MKKIVSLLLALCLTFGATLALAADNPFKPGVNYGEKYNDNGARPSMLNFGSAVLAPGEWFGDKSVEKTKVEQISSKTLERSLGRLSYYIYAKWQNAFGFDYNFIDAMLVMTDPKGNYYAVYDEWEQWDGERNMMCYWYFDVTNCFERCLADHGSLPKGPYTFSLFFNDESFRVTKLMVE